MPFLTLTDPRAKIKGSRDPLGLQSIWTRFGRRVVTNLTTVTTSVRGFTTLILGLYFADQAVVQRKAGEAEFSELFLKFEQLAAYSRVAVGKQDDGILGIQRVKKNLSAGKNQVTISARPDHQILSNQKTYGLWGLYTVAARNSGLLTPGTSRLAAHTIEFVETEYMPRLGGDGQQLLSFFKRERVFRPTRSHADLASSLADIMKPRLTASERAFYAKHLLFGGEKDSPQQKVWQQIKAVNRDDAFGMRELRTIIAQTKKSGDDVLAGHLENIRDVERVIAPLAVLFGYILSQDGQTVDDIVKGLSQHWGQLNHIKPTAFKRAILTVEDVNEDTRARLIHLAETLQAGDYAQTLKLLLAQNKAVMADRGSNVWITLKHNQLDVRFQDDSGWLPSKKEVPDLWLNTYFINSLKQIGLQIR